MRLRFAAAALFLTLAACTARTPKVEVEPAVPSTAAEAGFTRVPGVEVDMDRAIATLEAFRLSCPKLLIRDEVSGLTEAADWQAVCAEAETLPDVLAPWFFANRFAWLEVGGGEGFATGYFEPEIPGSREKGPDGDVPIYAVPDDLTRCYHEDLGKEGRGRLDPETGNCLYYFTRAEIDAGALEGRGLEIGYALRPVDLFFLQIQGSGRISLPDGETMRIGYANQNGREYVAIGRLLRERGVFAKGEATMEGIVDWIVSHPEEGKALMLENPSYIFFRELEGPGPLGAMEVPVTPRITVAADPKFVPLGAPIFLDMLRDEADGLWIAQDTGGAIKGANRVDTFWGHGDEAKMLAGGMASEGRALVLIPREAYSDALARR